VTAAFDLIAGRRSPGKGASTSGGSWPSLRRVVARMPSPGPAPVPRDAVLSRYGEVMRRRSRAVLLAWLATLLSVGMLAGVARADGDPGSDVLVYQDLFAGSSAGLSVQQQARLGDLLKAVSAARFPIRVALIASPTDLGAVTALWRKPRSYARFLGLELSLA
jgi:hypothetical protein